MLGSGKERAVRCFSQLERQVDRQFGYTESGTCLAGEEQAAVGALRRCIRGDFSEEVTPTLRAEAGVGISWVMGRKAKVSAEESSKPWEGVWNAS